MFLGVVCTFMGFWLFIKGVQKGGAAVSASYSSDAGAKKGAKRSGAFSIGRGGPGLVFALFGAIVTVTGIVHTTTTTTRSETRTVPLAATSAGTLATSVAMTAESAATGVKGSEETSASASGNDRMPQAPGKAQPNPSHAVAQLDPSTMASAAPEEPASPFASAIALKVATTTTHETQTTFQQKLPADPDAPPLLAAKEVSRAPQAKAVVNKAKSTGAQQKVIAVKTKTQP